MLLEHQLRAHGGYNVEFAVFHQLFSACALICARVKKEALC